MVLDGFSVAVHACLLPCIFRFEGTLPCSLGSADNLAVMRLNGNSRLLGTLPEQLVLMPHLALLDARGTSMQEPKRLAASSSAGNSALTAVPRWMEISRCARSMDCWWAPCVCCMDCCCCH